MFVRVHTQRIFVFIERVLLSVILCLYICVSERERICSYRVRNFLIEKVVLLGENICKGIITHTHINVLELSLDL